MLVSVIFLWYAYKDTNFSLMADELLGANYWWLLPNIGMVAFSMLQRAYRWQGMMQPIKAVSFGKLLSATCIGFMANNVLPLRLGEFVRAYALSHQEPEISKSASLATIFIERMVFDLVALLLILGGVVLIAHTNLSQITATGLLIAVAIALCGIGFVIVLALRPAQAGALLTRLMPFLSDRIKGEIHETVLKFSRGFLFLRDGKGLLWIGAQTVVIWLFMGLSNYFVFKAFHLHLPITASFVLLVMVSLSILIPSAPGFVGVFHSAAILTVSLYLTDMSPEEVSNKAGALAFVLHLAQYLTITAMGFYFLRTTHLSLTGLQREATGSTTPE